MIAYNSISKKIIMSRKNVHDITKEFEEELSRYTGAPYAIALDNMSNALFLALYYEKNINRRYGRLSIEDISISPV